MANRRAIVVSAIFAGLSAGLPLSMPAVRAASGDQCLTQPGPKAAPGQHWYYHLEHGRHCWYVRDKGGGVARASSSEAASPSKAQVRTNDTADSSVLENARDELSESQGFANDEASVAPAKTAVAAAPSQTAPAVAPDAAATATGSAAVAPPLNQAPNADQQPAVSSRWADPSAAVATAAPPPATDSANPAPSSRALPSASSALVPPPHSADNSTVEKGPVSSFAPGNSAASLETLFIVIVGALALAGLIASIVYRLGRARAAAQRPRTAIWPTIDSAPTPPWSEQAIPASRPDLHDLPRRAPRPSAAQERMQKIEELLEQLVEQARADA